MSARGDERLRVRMPPAIEVVSTGLITNLADNDSDSISKQDYHLTKRPSTSEAVTIPAANNTAHIRLGGMILLVLRLGRVPAWSCLRRPGPVGVHRLGR